MSHSSSVVLFAAFFLAPGALAGSYISTCVSQDHALVEGPPVSASQGITTIRIGANSGNGRNAVLIFPLPVLGAGEEVVFGELAVDVAGHSGTPTFNGDLWGIGFQSTPDPILEYFEADAGDVGNTKLEDNIFRPSTPNGLVISTNAAAIGAYLQTFYAANPGYAGGTYVFLRLNPDANADAVASSIGWSISAYENSQPALLTITTSDAPTNQPPPSVNTTNVIVIITDDQRWDSMGVVQREMSATARFPWFTNGTPNMDRLAAEGVRFRNAFVTTSLCSPSRAAMLTGRYNHFNGVINNSTPFPISSVTWASQLRAAGYVTGMVGKWHMSTQSARPGFDYYASYLGQGAYENATFYVNGVATPSTGWVDEVATDYAIGFLNTYQSNSFALLLGYKTTHTPHTPPAWAAALYGANSAQPTPNIGIHAVYRTNIFTPGDTKVLNFHRCLTAADAGIGRILDRLEQLGLTTNTMVIFLGDNGFYLGEHGLDDKRTLYEESLRIPLLMRYPRLIIQPAVRDELVLNIDIAPTILDLTGLTVPAEMQGRSWRPLLTGAVATNWRQTFLAEYILEPGYPQIPTTVTLRTADKKFTLWPGHPEWSEMFDLNTDRYEVTNLFFLTDRQATRDALRNEFDRELRETGLAAELTKLKFSNGGYSLSLTGGMGPHYEIQRSTDLQTWAPIGEVKMDGWQADITDMNAPPARSFYRAYWIAD